MTHHNRLTDAAVRAKDKAPGYYLDGRGLYLQVAPGGSRSWILRFPIHGRIREMGLGSIHDLGLAKAREKAQQVRELIKQGADPIEQRKQELVNQRVLAIKQQQASVTFETCAREYHAAHLDEWKNAKHGDQWINTLSTYAFPFFGSLPIREVGKVEILEALEPIWKPKAETASRVMQRIRMTLNYGAAKDYCPGVDAEFWKQVKLALGPNERARQVEHHSSCPHKGVKELVAQVKASTATLMVKLAFEFIVLTAARTGEVRAARWSEFDAQLQFWTIPAGRMKAGREHRIPLTAQAAAVLKQAKKLRAELDIEDGNDLVFPNQSAKPFSDMVFTQLLRRLKVPYTMHGFRSSFRTWGMEETDYPHEMLEIALSHIVGDQTVRAYARGDMLAKRRQLMDDWSRYISGTLTVSR